MLKYWLLISFLLPCSRALAATVAVLDTGIDYQHQNISTKVHVNYVEKFNHRDDDNNGYIDDLLGWNFIDNNNTVFDFSQTDSFGEDHYRYYEVRYKKLNATATEEELRWYQERRNDAQFMQQHALFRRHIHGTHVAGLAVNALVFSRFLVIKYLGEDREPLFTPTTDTNPEAQLAHLKRYFLEIYASWQERKLFTAVSYAAQFARVLNGSFGKSFSSTLEMVKEKYQEQLGAVDEEICLKLTNDFLKELINRTERIARTFSEILFVFSAGNGKSDNDRYPHYPSDARGENVIAVGASGPDRVLAYFSNYGKQNVDVLAPGIGIYAAVPGERYLPINGTSQSAPQVSNLALYLLEKRANLGPAEVKAIILRTADKKDELMDVVASGGTINPARAFKAIQLMWHGLSLDEAVKTAQEQVQDIPAQKSQTTQLVEIPPLIEAF